MKAVVLEEQGVINVREVPDVPAPGLGGAEDRAAYRWCVRFRPALLHSWSRGQICGGAADDSRS